MKYYNIHYYVETGYTWDGLSKEKTDAFYDEIKELFTASGWEYIQPTTEYSGITVKKGKSSLYCHPTSLSGPIAEDIISSDEVEKILERGKTFTFRYMKNYGELKDWTDDEYKNYLKSIENEIEQDLLSGCKTARKNLCVDGYQVCWNVAKKYRVNRITSYMTICSSDIEQRYVREVFEGLIEKGKITVIRKSDGGERHRALPDAKNKKK